MNDKGYAVIIREGDFEDGDRFEARVVELPDVLVFGETLKEVWDDINDVIDITIEICTSDGMVMPIAQRSEYEVDVEAVL